MRRVAPFAALAALALGACSKPVKMPVRQFDVPAPAAWTGTGITSAAQGPEWWVYLDAAGLDAAIRKSLACSDSLRAVAARIEAAREEHRMTRASALPELSLGTSYLRQRQNFVGLPFPGLGGRVLSSTFTNAGLNFNVGWEADLWNRVGAEELAADATVGARMADLAAARLSLSGQVAKAWVAAAEAGRQVDLARQVAAHAELVAARTRERYAAGLRLPLDVRLAEADIARAQAAVQQREQQRDAFVRQVETLVCDYPSGKRPLTGELPALPDRVPAGLPSELVHRRPDVLAAERTLLASDARIAQAKTALRPSFALTAAVGTASDALVDLVNPSLQVWDYALGVTQPLFNRGRLKANVRATQARADEAAANYEGRIRGAYQEVETALGAAEFLRQQEQAQRAALEATRDALGLAQQRFGAGMADVFTVLSLRRSALEAESVVLSLRRARIDNRIDLHLALGGGFAGALDGAGQAGS